MEVETWIKDIIVLILEKRAIEKLEGQTRGMCIQSLLAQWYCGCLRRTYKMNERVQNVHTFGFEEGSSATEITMTIPLLAAAGCEIGKWCGCLQCFIECEISL